MTMDIKSYAQAKEYFEQNRKGKDDWVKVANNTTLHRWGTDEIGYRIKLYETYVVAYYRDGGAIELDSGGYRTKTTLKIMNQFLPNDRAKQNFFTVYQKNKNWYVESNTEKHDYFDGMYLYPNGTVSKEE